MHGYDEWKQTDPNDRWLVSDDEREEGCTCSGALGAGGRCQDRPGLPRSWHRP